MRHRWQHASASQRFTVASLGLLILLFPVLLWAIFSQTRFWSKAAPATPPATAPIVTPTPTSTPEPPSTKIISFEKAITVLDPKYVTVKQRVANFYKNGIEITKIGMRINPIPGASYKFSVWSDDNGKVGKPLGEKIIKNAQPAGQDWVYATFDQPITIPTPYFFVGVERAYVYFTLIFSVGNDGNGNTYISDGNFDIQKPYDLLYQVFGRVSPTPTPTPSSFLRVVYPNGGEVLQEGRSYTMRWEASADIDKIDYAFRSPDGKYNYWINSSPLPNTGSAQITIANPAPKQYSQYYLLIKGTKTGAPLLRTDTSDGVFGILPPPPTPTFTPTPTPTPTPIRVPVACLPADLDRNGTVDERDYNWIAVDFFSSRPSNLRTDINHDGIVDLVDYSLLVQSYGKKTGSCL